MVFSEKSLEKTNCFPEFLFPCPTIQRTLFIMSFGPALPAHLAHLAQDSSRPSSRSPTSDGDDDDDYGPALPPHLAASRQAGSSRPSGPHFPSYPSPSEAQPLTQARSQPQAIEDDESDEEIIGPRPVTRAVGEEEGSAVKEFMEREARWAKEREVSHLVSQY